MPNKAHKHLTEDVICRHSARWLVLCGSRDILLETLLKVFTKSAPRAVSNCRRNCLKCLRISGHKKRFVSKNVGQKVQCCAVGFLDDFFRKLAMRYAINFHFFIFKTKLKFFRVDLSYRKPWGKMDLKNTQMVSTRKATRWRAVIIATPAGFWDKPFYGLRALKLKTQIGTTFPVNSWVNSIDLVFFCWCFFEHRIRHQLARALAKKTSATLKFNH